MGQLPDSREGPGAGALEPVRQDFQPVSGSNRKRWPITDQIRQLVVDEVVRIVRTGRTPALQIAAAKVLLAADLINARREGSRDEERMQEARAQADAMRDAMRRAYATPEGRAFMERLSHDTLRAPCRTDLDQPCPSGAIDSSAAAPHPPGGLFP
jgi:hypothetical protein